MQFAPVVYARRWHSYFSCCLPLSALALGIVPRCPLVTCAYKCHIPYAKFPPMSRFQPCLNHGGSGHALCAGPLSSLIKRKRPIHHTKRAKCPNGDFLSGLCDMLDRGRSTNTYILLHVCMFMCICICIYTCMCFSFHEHVCENIYIYIHIYIYICMYTIFIYPCIHVFNCVHGNLPISKWVYPHEGT